MLLWFVFIAVLGAIGIVSDAARASSPLDPRYAAAFLLHNGISSLAILGAVFLCVTGAEAMYADMGHIGREPIRIAWTVIVLPALLLNYAGQTAVVLSNPGGQRQSVFPAGAGLDALSDDRACPRSRPSSPAKPSLPARSR